ncbi:polysaccharide biosynthesis/export family protein [Planctomicrobium sp. SH668]|uniref:polysaccharide biosynthesis/export family protein n=1 Tax=Planctomicrobium sp. SH668 TaxID=3448126 RepID=UPI003F5C1138
MLNHRAILSWVPKAALCSLVMLGVGTSTGCNSITSASKSVPASRIDSHLFGEVKEAQVPVHLAALGQERPAAYRLGPGDTLAVFVYGVIPSSTDETPVLSQYQTLNQRYYPPSGSTEHPTTGIPMTIGADGALEMPLMGRMPVAGLTIQELSDKIKEVYRDLAVIAPGRERVNVSVITKRVHRIVVVRQDTPNPAVQLTSAQVVDQIHRGSGEVIDLPAFENDVLHALAATGGLPGTDGVREVWVMRNCALKGTAQLAHKDSDDLINNAECGPSVIRIPLYAYPGEPLPFSPKDVVLEAGDVVYIPRRLEYFYTGGLLGGAKIPMPRDEDVDVIEAITLAFGSIGGPLGTSGGVLANGTPGWAVKPTRAVILRKLPDGSQISIRVDLAKAMHDPKERILIQADDLVMLNFTPVQGTTNAILTFFGFTFNAPIIF